MTASVKAMLQTLIEADLKSTGEVSQGTKEAAQAQGFTIAGDGSLERQRPRRKPPTVWKAAITCISRHRKPATITRYTTPTTRNWTEASLTIPTCPLWKPEKKSLPCHELPAGTMEPLTGDGLDDFLEAAEQANAIPQPQAWNRIDGLLNGNP